MSNVTQGPWRKAHSGGGEFGCVTVVGKGGAHVAEVWNGGTRDPEVAEANADLVCAAYDHMLLLQAMARLGATWERAGNAGRLVIRGAVSVLGLDQFGCPKLRPHDRLFLEAALKAVSDG